MKICVFCGSSEDLKHNYYEEAENLGKLIGESGHHIIYGAGQIGLMGRVAKAVRKSGGTSTGVIPERLMIDGVVSREDTELIVTLDMKERKAVMRDRSDAFLSLPGGFGTMEELLETITLKQLQYHNKAIVILNSDGFYDEMLNFFELMYKEQFANPSYRNLYYVANTPEEALSEIEEYKYEHIYDKYLKS